MASSPEFGFLEPKDMSVGGRIPPKGDVFLSGTAIDPTVDRGIEREDDVYTSSQFELESPCGEEARISLLREVTVDPDRVQSRWDSSENLRYITAYEATHRALDLVYSGPRHELDKTQEGFETADFFMRNLHTSMGARNRFRIVQQIYGQEIAGHFSLNGHSGDMNTLSIAAGSSRAVMEKIADMPEGDKKKMNLRLIDVSEDAIADGRALADNLGLTEIVDFKQVNFLRSNRYLEEGYLPHFTEIVGLCDYVSNDLVVYLLGKIHESMPEGGSVLYSSVRPNDEQPILHNIIGWREMYYRGDDEMVSLAEDAGFGSEKIELIKEPLGMCNLVLARK